MQYVRHVLCFVFRTTVDRKCSRPMLIPAANGTGRDRMEPILRSLEESGRLLPRADLQIDRRIGLLLCRKDAQSKSGNTETSLHAHKTVKINQYSRRRPNHRDTLSHLCLRLHSLHLSLVHPAEPWPRQRRPVPAAAAAAAAADALLLLRHPLLPPVPHRRNWTSRSRAKRRARPHPRQVPATAVPMRKLRPQLASRPALLLEVLLVLPPAPPGSEVGPLLPRPPLRSAQTQQ